MKLTCNLNRNYIEKKEVFFFAERVHSVEAQRAVVVLFKILPYLCFDL